jgi:hypothetical protein
MEANGITSLLNVTPDIEEYNEIKIETNSIETTLTLMEKCLQQTNAIKHQLQLQVIHMLVPQKD